MAAYRDDGRSRIGLYAATAIGVVVLLFAGWFIIDQITGSDDNGTGAEPPPSRGVGQLYPHGPAEIIDGLPIGFTHDSDGAIAAASHLMSLMNQPFTQWPDGLAELIPAERVNDAQSAAEIPALAEGSWSGAWVMASRVEHESDLEVILQLWVMELNGTDYLYGRDDYTVRVEMVWAESRWILGSIGQPKLGAPAVDEENSVPANLLTGWWLLDGAGQRTTEIVGP